MSRYTASRRSRSTLGMFSEPYRKTIELATAVGVHNHLNDSLILGHSDEQRLIVDYDRVVCSSLFVAALTAVRGYKNKHKTFLPSQPFVSNPQTQD